MKKSASGEPDSRTHPTKLILYVITKSELGGAQSHLLELMKGFGPRYRLAIACGSVGPLTESAENFGICVIILRSLMREVSVAADIVAVYDLIKVVRQLRPMLLHAHSTKAGLISRVVGLLTSTPVVFTAHGWGFKAGVPIARRSAVWLIEFLLTRFTHRIICVSESDHRMACTRLLAMSNSLHVPNGISDFETVVDFDALSHRFSSKRLLWVGRLQEPKDLARLLRSIALAQDQDLILDVVGDGPDRESLQESAHSLGISARVRFLGSQLAVDQYMRESALLVLLSKHEGMPIAILEAMRSGLPAIASDVGGCSEVIVHGQTGWLVADSLSDSMLAQQLVDLVAHPIVLKRAGLLARARYLDRFRADEMIRQVAKIYEEVALPSERSHNREV